MTAIDATSGQVKMAPSAPGSDILRTEVSPDGSRVATLTTRAPLMAILMMFEMTRDYHIVLPLISAGLISAFIFSKS